MKKIKLCAVLSLIVISVLIVSACTGKDDKSIFVNPDYAAWTLNQPKQINGGTVWQSTIKVKITLYRDTQKQNIIESIEIEVYAINGQATEFTKVIDTPVNVGIQGHNVPAIFSVKIV